MVITKLQLDNLFATYFALKRTTHPPLSQTLTHTHTHIHIHYFSSSHSLSLLHAHTHTHTHYFFLSLLFYVTLNSSDRIDNFTSHSCLASKGRKVVAMFTLGLEGPELDDEEVAAGLVIATFDSSS